VVINKTDGEASKIKINLNVKDDKKEEEQKPVEEPKEDIKPIEDIKEIDSGDIALPEKVYSEFGILKYMSNEKNYMVSPFSLKMALMMTANGATGETQKEILEAFGIEDITAYNQKAEELINRYNNTQDVSLHVANSIWLNKDIALNTVFNEEFKTLVAQYYKGEANDVSTEEAVSKINSWVEEKTNGKIKDLLDDPMFISALINTLYFKGEWANQFDAVLTEKEMFTDINGLEVEKDFMNKTNRFNYYEDETMQLVKMPYKDFKTAMYIAIPKEDNIELDLDNAINNMVNKKVNVSIPKFKVEYSITLNDILKQMEIRKAFGGQAEFDKMFTTNSKDTFYISQVLQKTFIEVDENGTEAAAATAVILKATSARPQPEEIIDFVANKPFVYFIRDDESGEVLFVGEILH
jgi:serpin B